MEHNQEISISCVPNEIIIEILLLNSPCDIINFGKTCKRYYQLIKNNNYLWKHKYVDTLSLDVMKDIERHAPNTKWLKALKDFYIQKNVLQSELASMPKEYYWRKNEFALGDMGKYFQISTKTPVSYYYSIYIIRKLIGKINTYLNMNRCLKPLYTLPVYFYSLTVLGYLVQLYLVIKWVKLMSMENSMSPLVVVLFFLQWIDPVNVYDEKIVENEIQIVVNQVKEVLTDTNVKNPSERDILTAISYVMYKTAPINILPNVSISSLNIVKVIQDGKGCAITFGAIYQAVAEAFDIKVDLIAFTNHLFLQWKSNEGVKYVINIHTGEIKPNRQCPFTPRDCTYNSNYCPVALLHNICSAYLGSTRRRNDEKTKAIARLFSLIGSPQSEDDPFQTFLYHLYGKGNIQNLKNTNLNYMSPQYLRLINSLYKLNESPPDVFRRPMVKHRYINVKYAVGMICYHAQHKYLCVIREWEPTGRHIEMLPEGINRQQPFYRVLAADETERYISQDNLKIVTRPTRLHSMEEFFFKEFSHFDGFSYISSDEKASEYPGDCVYNNMYKSHHTGLRQL